MFGQHIYLINVTFYIHYTQGGRERGSSSGVELVQVFMGTGYIQMGAGGDQQVSGCVEDYYFNEIIST